VLKLKFFIFACSLQLPTHREEPSQKPAPTVPPQDIITQSVHGESGVPVIQYGELHPHSQSPLGTDAGSSEAMSSYIPDYDVSRIHVDPWGPIKQAAQEEILDDNEFSFAYDPYASLMSMGPLCSELSQDSDEGKHYNFDEDYALLTRPSYSLPKRLRLVTNQSARVRVDDTHDCDEQSQSETKEPLAPYASSHPDQPDTKVQHQMDTKSSFSRKPWYRELNYTDEQFQQPSLPQDSDQGQLSLPGRKPVPPRPRAHSFPLLPISHSPSLRTYSEPPQGLEDYLQTQGAIHSTAVEASQKPLVPPHKLMGRKIPTPLPSVSHKPSFILSQGFGDYVQTQGAIHSTVVEANQKPLVPARKPSIRKIPPSISRNWGAICSTRSAPDSTAVEANQNTVTAWLDTSSIVPQGLPIETLNAILSESNAEHGRFKVTHHANPAHTSGPTFTYVVSDVDSAIYNKLFNL
jgi:hypothetical protein